MVPECFGFLLVLEKKECKRTTTTVSTHGDGYPVVILHLATLLITLGDYRRSIGRGKAEMPLI